MEFRGIRAPMREGRVTSADGTSITYYEVGTGPRRWLMPPAMGAPLIAMKHILERFAEEFTIVSWDQRGFYRSSAPADPEAFRVEDHMRDMEAVIAATGLERFVLGGWSMAVQLSLELQHRRPDAVQALVLINGPFERALASIAPGRAGELAALGALRAAVASKKVLMPLSRRILGAPGMGKLLHRVGIVAENPGFFEEVLAEFCRVDWGYYFTMTRHLHDHSAAAYLSEIKIPTLITTGTRDFMTPVATAERLHRAISGSELFVVPRATHYIVTEFPELLTRRIAEFLSRVPA
jgi:pimeloyl-ACP methyl ester carboxylesterase